MTGIILPNQISAAYVYNAGNELTGLAWALEGETLGNLGYGFDNRGLLVAQSGSFAPKALPSKSTGLSSFDDNNRQTRYNGQALTYDANGNLLSDGTRNFEWNARNELVSVMEGGTIVAQYNYDALGRRVGKTERGRGVAYLYDGSSVIQENDGVTNSSIFAGLGIDQRFARNLGGTRAYFLTDHLGSTRALVDNDGETLVKYDNDPYVGTASDEAGMDNAYQFTGRELDGSGLYYYRARYYHSGMGRFIFEGPNRARGRPEHLRLCRRESS